MFSPIGETGQEKLKQSHVLIVGAGALGTSISEILARAGVGKLSIVDRDYVEWSNLQRQQLYTEEDAQNRIPKAVSAERRLKQVNSEITIQGHVADVSVEEIERYITGVDLIIDATDNFETRMLLNDASQKYNVPWIYGGCTGSHGLTFTVIPEKTPCFACLLGAIPMSGETCDTVGIISPAVQMVTAHQATEAFKILVGDYDGLRNTLLFFDLWKNEQASIKVASMQKKECPSCGDSPSYPYLNKENQTRTAILCGRDTVQIRPPHMFERDLSTLKQKLQRLDGKVEANPFLINLSIDNQRMVIFKDGRVLVHGTKDITTAKSLYNRYIGG